MSLPAWVNECGLHGMSERHAKVVKALSIAWEALEKTNELDDRFDHDIAKEAMRRIEELGK